MKEKWELLIPHITDDPWDIAIQADALYECPKDPTGKRLGPLVPYAGKDPGGKNFVGDVYFNFAPIEEQPFVLEHFAIRLADKLRRMGAVVHLATTIVGMPDGGRTLGQRLAYTLRKRFVYPMKVPRPKQPGAIKEEFDFVFKRSELSSQDIVIVCDDVHNNFQNTDDCLEVIRRTGASVIALCSALNRSPVVDDVYCSKRGSFAGQPMPVASVIRKPLPEWQQDDPAVAADIAAGNIELKVKDNWGRLRKIMEDARPYSSEH